MLLKRGGGAIGWLSRGQYSRQNVKRNANPVIRLWRQ